MDDQLDLQEIQQVRNSILYDMTIDEALKLRDKMNNTDQELLLIKNELLTIADQGFFGYSYPGGLTTLFYGYSTKTRLPRDHH